ncbi:MAG: tetratricopeptide repeat protein [Candidatus Kapabacteria bacterium]|nr:tetratricopeptide repeat protein [Candidatus Kapabacteria bacterium]
MDQQTGAGQKDYDGSIADYTKAIEIDPQNAKAYYARGLMELLLGRNHKGCLDIVKAREVGLPFVSDEIMLQCK